MTVAQRKTAYLFILLVGLMPMAAVLASGDKEAEVAAYPGYMELKPPLIVNLATPRSYLKLSLQFFIETQTDADLITLHMPRLRDRMISLLGGREIETLMTTEAREQLRIELLDNLRKAMMEQTGRPAVSAVYFTDFIAQ